MTLEYKGRGDPQRSMALLWRARREPARGPKPSLAIEQIINAAIEIADADGLADVTMRRIAQRLGVGAMSLYTYIPGKAELLDVMLDQVYGETRTITDGTGVWRARLEALARDDWELYQRHPWILQVSESRALLGPNEIAMFESALQSVSGLGLSGREMVSVVNLVAGFVRGAAQVAIDAARAAELTGVSDAEWWETRAPILDEYFDPTSYPTVASVDMEGAFDPETEDAEYHVALAFDSFEFGLQRVLDGIEAFVQQRANEAEGTPIKLQIRGSQE